MFMVFARLCVCAPRVCSDCLKLQLQTIVSAVWAPGYEPRSSGRGAMLFNHRAVSPVPTMVTRAWRATVIVESHSDPAVAADGGFFVLFPDYGDA